MGVVSEVLGNHGAPHILEHAGKKYRLSLIDQRVKSAFEKARFQKAKEALAIIKEDLGAEEYTRQLQEKAAQYEAGEYEIFSPTGMTYIKTIAGMRLLLSLIIDCDQNELMVLVLAKKDEIIPLLGLILRESFPGLEVKAADESDAKMPDATAENAPEQPAAVPNA